MGRRIARLMLCSILAAAMVVEAGAVRAAGMVDRVVDRPYGRGALAVGVFTPATTDVAGYCNKNSPIVPGGSEGCVRIPVKRADRFVSLRIEDTLPAPVLGMVLTEAGEVYGFFCGETSDRLTVPPGRYLEVWLMAGNCPGTFLPSVPTSGKVIATFSRR